MVLGALPLLFEKQAALAPDRIAVVSGAERVTYGELRADVDQLAVRLAEAGAGPGVLVGILARRSAFPVAAMLAVLKTGAAYLPLDPSYPAARIELMLADSGAHLLLTDDDLVGREGSSGQRLDGCAYLIYTSGSTGRPKGVMVAHHAVVNLLDGMSAMLGSGPGHVWLAIAPLSFDMSVIELYLPLITGGRVVIADARAALIGKRLVELIDTEGVTHIQATPSGWRVLLYAGFHRPEVTALTGAEPLTIALAKELRAAVGRLINIYGPTEATVWSTAWDVPEDPGSISIGEPFPGVRVHVVDDRLDPAEQGELAIGGVGVSRGYLGRPTLTADRFVPDPYGHEPGSRLYLTGDLVRRGPGGLEYLHRADTQVKVRGHRVELGEVESAMQALPGVRQAVAAVRGDTLMAFVVGRCADLRARLGQILPAYMVPTRVIEVDSLPMTPNGKVDRSALNEPAP
ncbi:amino acid adenylation domain-containing protein [Nonomuraea sp. NPDC050663]|uniref:amino acid adenylation domain-containing protein n=1 Tax=Nonomuraea sp. NPDC050663 TaxID=3364370 RepID=UPI00379CA145